MNAEIQRIKEKVLEIRDHDIEYGDTRGWEACDEILEFIGTLEKQR